MTKLWRVLLVLLVLALGAMWIYVLAFPNDVRPPDTLDDGAFPAAAEAVCAATRAQLDALPRADNAPSAAARADVIDEANADLRTMVSRLRALVPANPHDGRILGLWLDDWSTFVDDRATFAEALRTDPAAKFFETDRGGEQISVAIDNLANVNRMASCATPDDV